MSNDSQKQDGDGGKALHAAQSQVKDLQAQLKEATAKLSAAESKLASNAEQIRYLELENASVVGENRTLKGVVELLSSRPAAAAAVDPALAFADKEKAARAKKVADMKAKAKREQSGEGEVALYIVGEKKAYRGGKEYQPGEIIRIPVTEDPSMTWQAAVDAPKAAELVPAPESGRASDRSVA